MLMSAQPVPRARVIRPDYCSLGDILEQRKILSVERLFLKLQGKSFHRDKPPP